MKIRISRTIMLALLLCLGFSTIGVLAQTRGDSLSDATIKKLAEYRLQKEGLMEHNQIDVFVKDQVITLSGTVQSLGDKQRAVEVANGTDGATGVQDQLVIKSGAFTDQQIAGEIAHSIKTYVFYDIFDWVSGEVHDGVYTMTGYVREPWRKQDYERRVEDIPGVRKVINNLKVLPFSTIDDQIRIAAARAIYNFPLFRKYSSQPNPPIHVIVDNGKVILEGVVNTKLEKQVAYNQVRSHVLSFEVINNLRVER